MEKNKGITLVALIITIIVMLILVAVSVNVIIKSNLIGTAEKTVDKYSKVVEEEGNLNGIKINGRNFNSYIPLPDIVAGERATENSNYNGAIIPKGFTISKAEGETTIDGGLVIYLIQDKTDEEIKEITWTGTELENLKKTYDQFVWVPISHEKINEMFICQGKTANNGNCSITVKNGVAECTVHNLTQMAGRLYATRASSSAGEDNYKEAYTEVYTANSGLREPDIATNFDESSTYLGYMTTITGDDTSYSSTAKFKETLQNDYNEIVKLVYNVGGYYVGRYETSNITTTKGEAIEVVAGTASGLSNMEWYYMYAQQKEYATNKNLGNTVKSSMMLGTCYDQMLEFVNVEGKYDVTKPGNALHNRDYSYGPWQTAGLNYWDKTQYKDLSKNIYDLEGNVFEWTTEADDKDSRVCRGGMYSYSNSASYRSNSNPATRMSNRRF